MGRSVELRKVEAKTYWERGEVRVKLHFYHKVRKYRLILLNLFESKKLLTCLHEKVGIMMIT